MSEQNKHSLHAHKVLLQYWGYKHFRPLQIDIIESVLNGKDTLALLPTGGGKSICFQVPAMMMDGLCVVITPLIALMKDQVIHLKSKGISALAIYSGMTKREIDIELDNCIQGKYKFLYLSPERLQTEIIAMRLPQANVNLIAIDEAHCISQWGYDFRPSYLKIHTFKEIIPNAPLLALTATATPLVVKDIIEKLEFNSSVLFQKSFERKNIAYVVNYEENKLEKIIRIATNVGGSGLVYVRNRKLTQEISNYLNSHKVVSSFYHAGLLQQERDKRQNQWIENKTQVMVCTNAFGMGIDKPDVRFVIHYAMPDCIENYFQEAGRGGRDEKKAYAILLNQKSDSFDLKQQVLTSYPPLSEIKRVYQGLCNYFQVAIGSSADKSFDFDVTDFANTYGMKTLLVYNAVKLLERDEFIALSEDINLPSRIMFTTNKNLLYEFQVFNKMYDEFIKTILRSYGGVFDNYVNIVERDLAKRAGLTIEKTIQFLLKLEHEKLLKYLPQKSVPQLTFLRERKDARYIDLSEEVYEARKQEAIRRMEAMINYGESKNVCRNVLLLNYFEDKNTVKCGHCDVCIEERKAWLKNDEMLRVRQSIMVQLTHKKMTLTFLIQSLSSINSKRLVDVLNWMIDNGEVKEEDGLLFVN